MTVFNNLLNALDSTEEAKELRSLMRQHDQGLITLPVEYGIRLWNISKKDYLNNCTSS